MDNFHEQLVEKRRTGGDIAKIIGIVAGSVILAAVCLFFGIGFQFVILDFLGIGVMVLGIWLLGGMGIEYEYIITNDELDIDKIIGKRKRKRLITLDLKRTEDFCAYSADKDLNCDTTVQAATGWEKDAHCLVVNHEDLGKVNLIFNPDEITREAILRQLPTAVRSRIKTDVK